MSNSQRRVTILAVLSTAFEALRRNAMRSWLTALGIIIGVGSVIVMMALGDGAKASIEASIRSAGTNLITVFPGSAVVGGARLGQGAVTTLSADDAEAIREQVPGVLAVSPNANTRAQVVGPAGNWSTSIQGTSEELPVIRSWTVETGEFFTAADVARAARVAVLGAVVRDEIIGPGTDAVGVTIRINNQPFRVVGVLARKGQAAMGPDQDDAVIVPYTTVQRRLLGITHVNSITVSAEHESLIEPVSEGITALLRQRHRLAEGEPDDFTIRTMQEMTTVLTSTTQTMSYLLAAVAAVSLIVGGIGVTNIMLVSVTERTKEIGLRMSLGARRSDVLLQFLVEALTLSIAGGLAGVLLGIGASWLLTALLQWSTDVSLRAIMISFGCAFGIGAFFGWMPAKRAAALNPIDALRYE